jgi:hypothetical protein
MFAKLTLMIPLLFGILSQPVLPEGLDLNPAVLGCIMSGGECLSNTGIPIIDAIFGGNRAIPQYTLDKECRDLRDSWCSGNGGYAGSGFVACKESKKAYYKQKAKAKGEWIPSTTQIPNNYRMADDNYNFQLAEDRHGEDYFVCTGSQRQIYMKARCGVKYMDWRYLSTETMECEF